MANCYNHIDRMAIDHLKKQNKDLREKLAWLCEEVLTDHKLDRLSIDSEDCAQVCKGWLDEN